MRLRTGTAQIPTDMLSFHCDVPWAEILPAKLVASYFFTLLDIKSVHAFSDNVISRGAQPFGARPHGKKSCLGPGIEYTVTRNHKKKSHNV